MTKELEKYARIYGRAAAHICKRLGVKPDSRFAPIEIRQEENAFAVSAFSDKKCVELVVNQNGQIALTVERAVPQKKPFVTLTRMVSTTVRPYKPVQKFSSYWVDGRGETKRQALPVPNETATRRRLTALARGVTKDLRPKR